MGQKSKHIIRISRVENLNERYHFRDLERLDIRAFHTQLNSAVQ